MPGIIEMLHKIFFDSFHVNPGQIAPAILIMTPRSCQMKAVIGIAEIAQEYPIYQDMMWNANLLFFIL